MIIRLKLKQVKLKTIFIYCILIGLPIITKAQESSFFLLEEVPQTKSINPAFSINSGWYLSVPVLGGIERQISNSGFSWSQLVDDDLSSTLQNNNIASLKTSIQLLGGGIALDNVFLTVNLNYKRTVFSYYPESFLDFRKGNWDYDNNSPLQYSTSGFKSSGFEYTELAVGISKELSNKTIIGVRLKYLMGIANFKTKKMDLRLTTEQDGQITFNSDASLYTSLPGDVEFVENGPLSSVGYKNSGFPYMKNNHGVAVDIGFKSNIAIKDKEIVVGVALNDIGFIKWSENAKKLTLNDTYLIDGSDITDVILNNSSSTIIDYWEAVRDSIDDNISAEETPEKYISVLPSNLNITAAYRYNHYLDFGVLLKGNLYEFKRVVPQLGLSVAYNYSNVHSIAFSYLLTKNTYSNIGIGFTTKYKMFQFYGATSNILALVIPQKSKLIDFRIGINIIPTFSKSSRFSKSNYRIEAGF